MAETLPPTMRAWKHLSSGSPRSVLELDETFPTPSPPKGSDVLIKVAYSSLNPGGPLLMSGIPRPFYWWNGAYTPELDFSGTVHLAGPSTPAPFATPGTPVFGEVDRFDFLKQGRGALAEYIVVPASLLAVKPRQIPMAEAGGVSAGGFTAVKMVHEAGVKAGDRVLVNGASGGVGSFVVQVAKAYGATVVGVCSGRNAETVKSLGADQVVDYTSVKSLPEHLSTLKPFDAILDTIGVQALYNSSARYLVPNGKFINVGAYDGGAFPTVFNWFLNSWLWSYLPQVLGGVGRPYRMFSTPPNAESARELARLAEEGKLRVLVDRVLDMEDALDGYDRILSKRTAGKILVKVGRGE